MGSEDWRNWASVYGKGLAMGAADAVPGVSGGTIALITGIYERLIAAITSFNFDKVVEFASSFLPSDPADPRQVFSSFDGTFLAVVFAGILTSILTVLKLVHHLLTTRPVMTFGFFFGLIAVSAVVLYRSVDLSTDGRKAAALTGFLLAFLFSGYASTSLGHSPVVLFLSGAAAVSAMVLPGISGSLILIILGQYSYMTGVVSRFTDALASTFLHGAAPLLEAAFPVFYFVSGALAGLFTVSHLVRRALKHRRQTTLAFLVSMVVGALRAPVLQVQKAVAEGGLSLYGAVPVFLTAAAVGGVLVYLLDRYTGGIGSLDPEEKVV